MNRLAPFSYTWTRQADAWAFRGGNSQHTCCSSKGYSFALEMRSLRRIYLVTLPLLHVVLRYRQRQMTKLSQPRSFAAHRPLPTAGSRGADAPATRGRGDADKARRPNLVGEGDQLMTYAPQL